MGRTFAEDLVDDAATIFLNAEEFAESVTRHVAGVENPATDVTATGDFFEDQSERQYETGDRIVRMATLQVAQSVTVADRDAWTVRSQRWDIVDGEYGQRLEGGLRMIRLQRVEKVETSQANKVLR